MIRSDSPIHQLISDSLHRVLQSPKNEQDQQATITTAEWQTEFVSDLCIKL